jgi:hypothetical protein
VAIPLYRKFIFKKASVVKGFYVVEKQKYDGYLFIKHIDRTEKRVLILENYSVIWSLRIAYKSVGSK